MTVLQNLLMGIRRFVVWAETLFCFKHDWFKFWSGRVLCRQCVYCRKLEIIEPTPQDIAEREAAEGLEAGYRHAYEELG